MRKVPEGFRVFQALKAGQENALRNETRALEREDRIRKQKDKEARRKFERARKQLKGKQAMSKQGIRVLG